MGVDTVDLVEFQSAASRDVLFCAAEHVGDRESHHGSFNPLLRGMFFSAQRQQAANAARHGHVSIRCFAGCSFLPGRPSRCCFEGSFNPLLRGMFFSAGDLLSKAGGLTEFQSAASRDVLFCPRTISTSLSRTRFNPLLRGMFFSAGEGRRVRVVPVVSIRCFAGCSFLLVKGNGGPYRRRFNPLLRGMFFSASTLEKRAVVVDEVSIRCFAGCSFLRDQERPQRPRLHVSIRCFAGCSFLPVLYHDPTPGMVEFQSAASRDVLFCLEFAVLSSDRRFQSAASRDVLFCPFISLKTRAVPSVSIRCFAGCSFLRPTSRSGKPAGGFNPLLRGMFFSALVSRVIGGSEEEHVSIRCFAGCSFLRCNTNRDLSPNRFNPLLRGMFFSAYPLRSWPGPAALQTLRTPGLMLASIARLLNALPRNSCAAGRGCPDRYHVP